VIESVVDDLVAGMLERPEPCLVRDFRGAAAGAG
jgi:hypothetical protein